MPALELKRDILIKARDRSVLSTAERELVKTFCQGIAKSVHTLDVTLGDLPLGFWKAVLDDSRLTANQRAVMAQHVFGMRSSSTDKNEIYESEVHNPVEFGSTFGFLGFSGPTQRSPVAQPRAVRAVVLPGNQALHLC